MVREIHPADDQQLAHLAIVVSRYNHTVTDRLLQGAITTLQQAGLNDQQVTVARVPGAWEVPLAAQQLAASGRFDAIICLGAVIRGATTHDQYINHQVSAQLAALALKFNLPILFGILTCQSLEQALQRAGGTMGNKGSECAQAALEMVGILRAIRGAFPANPANKLE
jgi:6,7-dimethyl-8-ribityllumazine synthase